MRNPKEEKLSQSNFLGLVSTSRGMDISASMGGKLSLSGSE